MNDMSLSDKPLLSALRGNVQSVPPVWLMRQAGRYLPEYMETRSKSENFLQFCYSPELAIEATLQPIRRFDLDGAIIFSDILVIPDALGQKVGFQPGRGPVLEALESPEAVLKLSKESVRNHLKPVYEAIRGVKAALPPKTTMIGFAGAPWTIASYMIEGGASKDYATLKSWAFGNPDGLSALFDILVDAIGDHLCAQIEAGAEVVQIFDSWAGILPAELFEPWCVMPIRRIAEIVKRAHPDVPILAFPNRCAFGYEQIANLENIDGVSIDSTVPLEFARDHIQPNATVQGNLDPILLVTGNEPMRAEARRIMNCLASKPFIFNLGHGIIPITPPDHVADLIEEIRKWRA
jgi:uroporphyrinogen decarboxylase